MLECQQGPDATRSGWYCSELNRKAEKQLMKAHGLSFRGGT